MVPISLCHVRFGIVIRANIWSTHKSQSIGLHIDVTVQGRQSKCQGHSHRRYNVFTQLSKCMAYTLRNQIL